MVKKTADLVRAQLEVRYLTCVSDSATALYQECAKELHALSGRRRERFEILLNRLSQDLKSYGAAVESGLFDGGVDASKPLQCPKCGADPGPYAIPSEDDTAELIVLPPEAEVIGSPD